MPSGVQRFHGQHNLYRHNLLLTRMIWDEGRGSKGHDCDVSVSNHPWLDCAVTISWLGCLPVAIRTCLSEYRCIPFRPVILRSNPTYRSFIEGARTS
jgi:hypothetical protein